MKNKINKNSTLREVLQIVGTELLREGFNKNVHVASTMANIKDKDNVIITDMRFPNELKAIEARDGICIRVIRPSTQDSNGVCKEKCQNYPNCKPCGGIQSEHESETALDDYDFDYIIDNNGTIEELIEKVRQILVKEKII